MRSEKYYIAYGSNLSLEQMAVRCPHAVPVGTALIEGYELLFKGSKTGSYLTIEKNPEGSVPAAIWIISDDDEIRLDRYEGYPSFYYKKILGVEMTPLSGGRQISVKALVYIMHEERDLGIPSQRYINICAEGYRRFGFDLKYLEEALGKSIKKSA